MPSISWKDVPSKLLRRSGTDVFRQHQCQVVQRCRTKDERLLWSIHVLCDRHQRECAVEYDINTELILGL